MTKAITHPVETLEAMAQNLNDTYEVEGLEYMGGYVIGDIVVGEISAAAVSKAVGKGAGAVDDIGNIANKADDVADIAETAGKMDDVVDAARMAEKTGDVAEIAGKGLQSSFVNNIEELLVKEGVSLDEFDKLRIQDVSTLTDAEKTVLKSVCESVPMPDTDTLMQKVIPASDIEKYLDGTYTQVGGYVTRAEDVVQLSTYEDIYNSL